MPSLLDKVSGKRFALYSSGEGGFEGSPLKKEPTHIVK
jgi:hypothetical protein